MILPDLKRFLSHHWQKKPLLIRGAFPDFKPLLDVQELIDLAGQDDVESRLLSRRGQRWQMQHGPFEADEIPPLTRKQWTLLVQGVDLHLDAAHELQQQFRFLPDARLDDLMISLASDRGGVGPHYDSYDVFLLQAWGRREWRVGPLLSRALVPDAPVKLLADFEPQQTWLLEPGDMLYLPPMWGHDGIAQGPCMTYSIGFRSPTRAEFLQAFFNDCSDRVEAGSPDTHDLYADPGLRPSAHPADIPEAMTRHLEQWTRQARPDADSVRAFIGRFLSEPKNNVWFEAPSPCLSPARFLAAAGKRGLRLHRASRMLLRPQKGEREAASGGEVFFNGEGRRWSGPDWRLLQELAENRRIVVPQQLERTEIGLFLYDAYANGWLALI